MSKDMTFCANKKCAMKNCKRHPNNITSFDTLHSFADLDGTEYCAKAASKHLDGIPTTCEIEAMLREQKEPERQRSSGEESDARMSKEEAIKHLEEIRGFMFVAEWKESIDMAITALSQPERPKGRWDDSFDGITPYCTSCGMTHKCVIRTPDFCPNCGSDNRGEEE